MFRLRRRQAGEKRGRERREKPKNGRRKEKSFRTHPLYKPPLAGKDENLKNKEEQTN